MNPLFRIRTFAALLTLSLASACSPLDPTEDPTEDTPANITKPEDIPLHVERTGDSLRFSWEGEKIHHFEVIQCNDVPSMEFCGCNGALVWGLGPNETEKFHDVALEDPFIASPLEYGVTPESDRKAYASRPLVAGKRYLVQARRVGPCDSNPTDCQQTIARGCQSFIW